MTSHNLENTEGCCGKWIFATDRQGRNSQRCCHTDVVPGFASIGRSRDASIHYTEGWQYEIWSSRPECDFLAALPANCSISST
jgi:hypothetical protein